MKQFWNTVPRAVRIAGYCIVVLAVLFGSALGTIHGRLPNQVASINTLAGGCLGLLAGAFVAIWLFCLGYVYADARRRAMPPVLWTLIAALIPNLLGFLLYFALRRPLAAPCIRCGRPVAADQRFCSWCGQEAAPFSSGAPPSPPSQSAHPDLGPSAAV